MPPLKSAELKAARVSTAFPHLNPAPPLLQGLLLRLPESWARAGTCLAPGAGWASACYHCPSLQVSTQGTATWPRPLVRTLRTAAQVRLLTATPWALAPPQQAAEQDELAPPLQRRAAEGAPPGSAVSGGGPAPRPRCFLPRINPVGVPAVRLRPGLSSGTIK